MLPIPDERELGNLLHGGEVRCRYARGGEEIPEARWTEEARVNMTRFDPCVGTYAGEELIARGNFRVGFTQLGNGAGGHIVSLTSDDGTRCTV